MTGGAPVDETGRTPHHVPAQPPQVAGEAPVPHPGADDPSSVQIAYCHPSRVSHSWHTAMMNMMAYDKTVGLNIFTAMPYGVSCNGPNSLVEGRNLAVEHFLNKTGAEWLMFIDTDMGFQPDAVERLLLAADPVERPVVGGLCFALKHIKPDGRGGFNVLPVPTLFERAKNEQGIGFANRFIYPPDTLVKVAGTGTAFLLIHRSVLEKIGRGWFDLRQYADGTVVSEDLSFCWRLGELGIPVHIDTRVKITHHKEFWLGEGDYRMPPVEPMGKMMKAALNHEGSDRWTGGDKKDER